jgi:hypothetical protein
LPEDVGDCFSYLKEACPRDEDEREEVECAEVL